MKKVKLAALLSACVLAATLTGCFGGGDEVSSMLESLPGNVESMLEPLPGDDEHSMLESRLESGHVGSEASGGSNTVGEEVAAIVTSDKEFNKHFEANPIDAAYKKEMAQATSNTEMIEVAEKYALIWQDEIASGFQKLMESSASEADKESFQQKQTSWEEGVPDALDKIASEAQAAGGSMAQVNIAGQTMEHYRSRAAAIYKNLYAYDKEFTYYTQF